MKLSVQDSGSAPQGTPYECGLCGLTFVWDPDVGATACARCPLNTGCGLVMCPNCGFEFPAKSSAVESIGKWLGLGRRGKVGPHG